MTEREREVLRGEADVSTDYVNQIRYRVREKIDRLAGDIDVLETHEPELAAYLRETLADALGWG